MEVPQWTEDREQFVDDLFLWLSVAGAMRYDEVVTQLEHAVQTAALARQGGATEPEVVAALLHDVGHLLVEEHQGRDNFLAQDWQHEEVGAQWLQRFFPPQVTEPIRLHVLAKRWLCTTDTAYWQGLSDASKRSLVVQGGKLHEAERQAFEANNYWQQAVALRRRDDLGKQPDQCAPALESFRDVVLRALCVS